MFKELFLIKRRKERLTPMFVVNECSSIVILVSMPTENDPELVDLLAFRLRRRMVRLT